MAEKQIRRVPELLRQAADIYEQRNPVYGDNYKHFGDHAAPLLAPVVDMQPIEISRLALLLHIQDKLSRYVANFNKGGHSDSLMDLAVYSMMLLEIDEEQNAHADI